MVIDYYGSFPHSLLSLLSTRKNKRNHLKSSFIYIYIHTYIYIHFQHLNCKLNMKHHGIFGIPYFQSRRRRQQPRPITNLYKRPSGIPPGLVNLFILVCSIKPQPWPRMFFQQYAGFIHFYGKWNLVAWLDSEIHAAFFCLVPKDVLKCFFGSPSTHEHNKGWTNMNQLFLSMCD